MNGPAAAAAPAAPLSVTWREWIASAAWRDRAYAGPAFDAIVVGSGYGGSAAALRLAQKGYRVLLLERGSEYLPGEFPNDFSLVPKYFRVNVPGAGGPKGRATGLVEMHLGLGMVAVTGNGLGGGSLINAGVVMEPDADVFAQKEWPEAIRHRRDGGLDRFFARAEQQLRVASWGAGLPDGSALDKTIALRELGTRVRGVNIPVKLTVDPHKCVRCGDCASGCNVEGAKGSLGSTYLQAALATGRVQIVTQAEVYRFEAARDARGARHAGWKLHVFATDAQQQFPTTRELFADRQPSGTWRTLEAGMLFVCAGTLGSTQLLQRSQSASGGALAFSPVLGSRVSGNGDSVSWITNQPSHVGGLSRGQAGVDAYRDAQEGRAFDRKDVVGPTITGAIDLRRPRPLRWWQRLMGKKQARVLPLQKRVLIEDCAIPRAIAQAYRELLATTRTLRHLDGWWTPGRAFASDTPEDPLGASDLEAQHTQTLLAMGHDGSPARLVWLEGQDSAAPYLPEPEKLTTYIEQKKLFARWGVRHVQNPLWEAMPRDAVKLITGPKPPHTVTTVHPLGGCVMGDDPACSVVNHLGQVWVADPGRGFLCADALVPVGPDRDRNAPGLYKGLYVLDGAIVPTSLGCNPLLTITALAERALEALPDKAPAAAKLDGARSEARAPQALPSREVPVDALLNEVLFAEDVQLSGAFARLLGGRKACARLEASFVADDIAARMRTADHRTPAQGKLVIGTAAEGAAGDANSVCAIYDIAGGDFTPLPSGAGSTGPWLLLRSALEFLLVIGGAVVGWREASIAGVLLALLVLVVLLPFPRTFLTWAVLRGKLDAAEQEWDWAFLRALPSWMLALLKQLVHATEKRVMRYSLELRLREQPPGGTLPERLVLHATKRVTYRASVPEVLRWLFRARRPCEAGGSERMPIRAAFWEQIMDARVRVTRAGWPAWGGSLLRGCFRMGFDNLTSSGLSPSRRNARGAMELRGGADLGTGILGLASYPSLFLRYAIKTRLLDFRLPTYSGRPVPDDAPAEETDLRAPTGPVPAELHALSVERGRTSAEEGSENLAPLALQLRRYRRPGGQGPEVTDGRWMDVPVARAKSVLLLHAFGQSGLTYTLKTVEENLAERFWREGYEVWVLESRMSTRTGYADDPCSVDQIAKHDVPTAVRHIVQTIAREQQLAQPVQISAFAQCIGSAALWMALLSGRLSHGVKPPGTHGEDAPQLSMLSHAMFSQVHPWVVGSRGTQSKTWVPGLLQVLWRRGSVPFAVRGAQDNILLQALDRVLSSLPAPRAEDRRPEGHDDAAATCRRIRFIEGPLFLQRNLNEATHGAMNLLFGDANLRLFAHARRFVDRERLVDEDGADCYVTDANLRRHLAFPVQLLHGAANELFDVLGVERSFERLRAIHPGWQDAFCAEAGGAARPEVVPGYGHLDVLIGQSAHQEVYPRILGFFRRCDGERKHAARDLRPLRWSARAPALGPFLGWLRREGEVTLLRVSFVVDDRGGTGSAPLPPVVVRCRRAGVDGYVTLQPPPAAGFAHPPLQWTSYRLAPIVQGKPNPARTLRLFAWADVPLPDDLEPGSELQLLTLHETQSDDPELLASPAPADRALDRHLEHIAARAPAGMVLPPPSDDEGFVAARASFRIPAEALETLVGGERVRFAAGCCRHPGLGVDIERVDGAVRAFLAPAAEGEPARDPVAFAMLLGDQIYADATAGLMDPWSPVERFCERHEIAFGREGVGQLLAAMPVYLTPDDHEWKDAFPLEGPLVRERWPAGGGGRQGFGERNEDAIALASSAVTAFQRLQAPQDHRGYYVFRHGCARFFVIDSREGRERNAPVVVAPHVLASLGSWLNERDAGDMLSVIACGSVILPGLRANGDPANPGVMDTWQYAPRQRAVLLELIVKSPAAGRCLLLSGDYHVSAAGYVFHDDRPVAAAVLAPPLHAPMPYANATPEEVFVDESVALASGRISLCFPRQGRPARGSGVGVLDVRRAGQGFEVKYRRELQVWEEGRTVTHEVTLHLCELEPAMEVECLSRPRARDDAAPQQPEPA